jgi:AMP phosphorylase
MVLIDKEFKIKKLDVDADELVVLMNTEDAREINITPMDRIIIENGHNNKVACVVDTTRNGVSAGTLGIYNDVYDEVNLDDLKTLKISRATKPDSVSYIKDKINGKNLDEAKILQIVKDIDDNLLSKLEISAFLTSLFINGMSVNESYAMAKGIASSGENLKFDVGPVVDKHSIGGINGRASMLTVPIVAATGLYMPKTSSRAITSCGGTADSMEVLSNVSFNADELKQIVKEVNGAIVWQGGLDLAPVDDKIIRVEYLLSLNPRGLIVSSVLAKKRVVGAQKVIIDLPVGKELKVKTIKDAEDLASNFITVGKMLGMDVKALITNGSVPSGPAFGPALEAQHALKILEGKVFDNLAEKATELAGKMIEMGGKAEVGKGTDLAKKILREGIALQKMKEIINRQGKKVDSSKEVPIGEYTIDIFAKNEGYIQDLSIGKLTDIAKIAGAPYDKGAGVLLHIEPNDSVNRGDLMFTIYASSKEKLKSAEEFAKKNNPISLENVIIEEM